VEGVTGRRRRGDLTGECKEEGRGREGGGDKRELLFWEVVNEVGGDFKKLRDEGEDKKLLDELSAEGIGVKEGDSLLLNPFVFLFLVVV
jgi:hypothetical protein